LAESIAFSLRSRGYTVFLDRDDLPAGESFDQQIERAVKDSDIFIFLISPDSVAEGRYTLSELTFARRKWNSPNGRILPIMARKTPIEQVPPYLKAVTILEPLGNITAEASAAIDDMRRGRPAIASPAPQPAPAPLAQPWVMMLGAIFGALTLLFFMGLVLLGVAGYGLPCNAIFLVNITLSLGAALAVAFLGGNASATGAIPFMHNSLAVGLTGGFAALIITLLVTFSLLGKDNCAPSVVSQKKTFDDPKYAGLRLDLCYFFAQSASCGAEAARHFCNYNNYKSVADDGVAFVIDPNIGGTISMGDNRTGGRDGFKSITCVEPLK
jgi:TIR domain